MVDAETCGWCGFARKKICRLDYATIQIKLPPVVALPIDLVAYRLLREISKAYGKHPEAVIEQLICERAKAMGFITDHKEREDA